MRKITTSILVLAFAVFCAWAIGSAQLSSAVSALSAPDLPSWITAVSPIGRAKSLTQIRIIFARDVAPLGAIDDPTTADILSHLSLEPALPGRFVLLTPRMIGFIPKRALPLSTRVRVTLHAGAHDLAGDKLTHDLAWTFHTARLAFSQLPSTSPRRYGAVTPSPLSPVIRIQANTEVNIPSLASHATLVSDGTSEAAAIRVIPVKQQSQRDEAQRFNDALRTYGYDLVPEKTLRRNAHYTLHIASGVSPTKGNLRSNIAAIGSLVTYRDFRVSGIGTIYRPSQYSRFTNGEHGIVFSNPVDIATLVGHVDIQPKPNSAVRLLISNDMYPSVVEINSAALMPHRTYHVRITSGVRDVFGNVLQEDAIGTLTTGDLFPSLSVPEVNASFPQVPNLHLTMHATNLSGTQYYAEFVPVSLAQLLTTGTDPSQYTNRNAAPVAKSTHTFGLAPANTDSSVTFDVSSLLGTSTGTLAYRIWANLPPKKRSHFDGLVSITDLGVFAQLFPTSGFVRVSSLKSGLPIQGASVAIRLYPDSWNPVGKSRVCAAGKSDAAGFLQLSSSDIHRCDANDGVLAVVTQYGKDSTFFHVRRYPETENFQVPSGGDSVGALFPDRSLYKPDESGHITGIAYGLKNDHLVVERNARYVLTISDPDGVTKHEGIVHTDAYGVFDFPLSVPSNADLGTYLITAVGPAGPELVGSYRVAEFHPPKFSLRVSVLHAAVVGASMQRAMIDGRYFFGGPLARATTTVDVWGSPAALSPSGYDSYTFGPQWFWPQQAPQIAAYSFDKKITLGDNGRASLRIPVPAKLPMPATFRVVVDSKDVTNLAVAASPQFLAVPDRDVIGISGDDTGVAGKPVHARIVVVRPDGKADGSRHVRIELQKATYTQALQPIDVSPQTETSVTYTTVDQRDIIASSKPTAVLLRPHDGGTYRIVATFGHRASETDTQVWVAGPHADFISERPQRYASVKLNKKQYHVGDHASALVVSPFDRARVTLDIVRKSVLFETKVMVEKGAVRIPFTVTRRMLPNAAVQVRVVRVGGAMTTLSVAKGPPLFAQTGMVGFTVDTSNRKLRVTVLPVRRMLAPGARQTVHVRVRDVAGHPVVGELIMAVVNDAVLQLDGYRFDGYRFPDIHEAVYRPQGIDTTFADSYPRDLYRYGLKLLVRAVANNAYAAISTPTPSSGSFGGHVRSAFLPLAYYSAHIRTDVHGNATVGFTLPDNLTTWRIMVIGLSHDGKRVGNGEATFIAAKPLVTNPLLPQFVRPGDRFYGGITVRNQTKRAAKASLRLRTTGALSVRGRQMITTSAMIPVGMQALRYAMAVGTPGPTTLQVATSLGGDSDAFRVPLSIRDRAVTQTTLDIGSSVDTANIPLASSLGPLNLVLANTAATQFRALARQALRGRSWPYADDVAAHLVLDAALGNDAAADLASVKRLHQYLGGYAFTTSDGDADPYATSAILRALAFARAHGENVALDDKDRSYVTTTLEAKSPEDNCKDVVCRRRVRFEMLATLAAWGDRRETGLDGIIASAGSFDDATQMRLARYLLALPGYHAKGLAMAQSFVEQTYLSGRFATYNVATPWSWLGNTVASQAQLVRLLAAMHASADDQDAAVRVLASQPCRCGWGDLYGTAQALVAVDAYERASPVKALTIGVRVGSYAHVVSLPAKPTSVLLRIPNSALPASAISLTTEGGRLSYIATLTQTVAANAPGALAGIRVTRTVRIAGKRKPLAVFDLASQPVPTTLAAGTMVDIGVRVIVDRPLDRIVIEDPLPAGLEAIDGTFAISPQRASALSDSWEIGDQQIYADRVTAYIGSVGPGVYEMHYFARAITPGTFRWPGVQATVRGAPEIFGRSATGTLIIK